MEQDPKKIDLSVLVARCSREINAAACGETHDEQYWRELLYRVKAQRDGAAREALLYHLRQLLRTWIGSHPKRELAYRLKCEEYYVTRACEQFWQAVIGREPALDRPSTALQYLRASLNGVVLDVLRAHTRLALFPGLDSTQTEDSRETAHERKRVYWESICKLLASEREQRIACLLFSCGLQPWDIVCLWPQEFNSRQEISRVRDTIMKHFLADEVNSADVEQQAMLEE